MSKYWSPSTLSFYDSNVCATSQMPSDKVQLTDTEYNNLMTQQAAGYRIEHNSSTGKPQAVAQNLTAATATAHEVTKATGSVLGHVTLSDSTASTSGASAGVAATPKAVKAVADAKAPNDHSSTATTYGVGNGTKYGHLKLSDSTSSTSGVSGGVAATPAAVKSVQDAVTELDGEVVHLAGAETITGRKTFTNEILTQHSITNAKNKSSADEFQSAMIFRDNQGQAFGHLQTASYADTGDVLVKLSAVTGLRKSTPDETTHYIGMGMRLDGTPYTTAPTPPANDDSTQIATTEWVGDNNAGSATKLKTARTFRTNLASTSTDSFDGSGNVTPGVTGTLPVGNGGTGMTASPSMLTNLASTTAANVFAASPRPGVTGILPIANGGTGSNTKNFVDLTSTQSIAGAKTFTGAIKAGVDALISHADDASVVRIDGGSGWDKGACILLYGKDEASYKGQGKFRVTDGTNTKEAIFKPDGTATWAGKNIVRSVNGTNADAAGNVALTKDDIVESLGYTPLQTAPVTSVNGKTGAVTISVPATPKAYVNTTWVSGSSWYRKWSDGWIEQGGAIPTNTGYSTPTITLNTAFTKTNYHVSVSNGMSTNANMDRGAFVYAKTTSNFAIRNAYSIDGNGTWYACGY